MCPSVSGLFHSASALEVCPRCSRCQSFIPSVAESHSTVWVSAIFGSRYNYGHFTDVETEHQKGFSCLLSLQRQDVRYWKGCSYCFQCFSSLVWTHVGLLLFSSCWKDFL